MPFKLKKDIIIFKITQYYFVFHRVILSHIKNVLNPFTFYTHWSTITFKWLGCTNFLRQILHSNCRLELWVKLCSFRVLFWLKLLSHLSHLNSRIFSWIFKCLSILCLSMKTLWQIPQVRLSSLHIPFWMCSLSWYRFM